MDFHSAYTHGFLRAAACTFPTAIAEPRSNADSVLRPLAPATPTGWRWRSSRS